jgi:ADP-ribose pyrophosphatase
MDHQQLNREKLYSGSVFDVFKVSLQLPNGGERVYDLVEHSGSVTIVPVDDQDRIYFVTQYRVGADDRLLELPAGVLEKGEDPLVSAKRELREEIGMAASEIKPLGSFFLAPGYASEYMTIFLAKGLYPAPLDPDEDEFLEIVTMPTDAVYQQAFAGEIKDGKTLAALLLALPHIKPGD